MKKIWALIALPVIALASCSKTEEVTNLNTTVDSTSTESVATQTTTWEVLNENISSTTVDSATSQTEKSFEFVYEIGWNKVPVKWKFILEDWKVKDMIIDWADINGKNPIDSFAKNAPLQVIWKELKWLKIDTVSWASYVTVWFNQFLSTIN